MKRAKLSIGRIRKLMFDVRVVYGLSGIIVSIVAHEVFHVLMHLGQIQNIAFFPDNHAIVAITTSLPGSYDLNVEEAVAYAITILILFVTVIDVFAIHDSRDKKCSHETLASSNHSLKDLDHETLLHLARRAKVI